MRIGTGHIDPLGLLGFELGHRIMLLELYGGDDPVAERLFHEFLDIAPAVPVPFLEIHKGQGAQAFGDAALVDRVVQRYGYEPDQVLRSLFGEYLLRVLAETVARAGATPVAAPVYETLRPYAGLLNAGGGINAGLPVDDVLGRLAILTGDVSAAIDHGRDAVALARSMPSPPMLVHCLDHLGDALARADDDGAEAAWAEAASLAAEVGVDRGGRTSVPAVAAAGDRIASIRRIGKGWGVTSPIGAAKLPESTGLGQLARLLATPGVEVTAVELAGGPGAPVASDLGPALDAQAKQAYRRRLLELQAEIDDAATANDPVRGERAQVEIDALVHELERAVGLGGPIVRTVQVPSGLASTWCAVSSERSLQLVSRRPTSALTSTCRCGPAGIAATCLNQRRR